MCRAGGASILLLLVALLSIQDAVVQGTIDCKGFQTRSCKYGFLIGQNTCVMLVSSELTYEETETYCQPFGYTLLSLDNERRYEETLCSVLDIAGELRVWVGGTRQGDGRFMWNNNVPIGLGSWVKGQPDNTGGEENCVEMNWKVPGQFNDDRCWRRKAALCGPV